MNIFLALISPIVIYEAAHFGCRRLGEIFVCHLFTTNLSGGFAEIVWIFGKFIIWLLKFYFFCSLFQLVNIEVAENVRLEVTNFETPAKMFLSSVTLDFIKGVFDNILSKKGIH